jgi:hypothetical protein
MHQHYFGYCSIDVTELKCPSCSVQFCLFKKNDADNDWLR